MRFAPGDLENTDRVENIRRSIVMLPPRSSALNREEAVQVLEALIAALVAARSHA